MKVRTPQCPECRQSSDIEVNDEDFQRWANGEHIQKVWPDWTPDQRELLITGTHPECWDKIFAGVEE